MEPDLPQTTPADRGNFLSRFLTIETSLYRYVCAVAPVPQDARDIVQETALALWEQRDRYDPGRPFLPWALRVARNKALQHVAKQGRSPRLLADESLLNLIVAEQATDEPALEVRREQLQACLEKLSSEHRALIRGYYWDGTGIGALADRLQTTVDGAYKRLQRVRRILHACMLRGEHGGATP